MKLSELKSVVEALGNISFQLPNGAFVPQHFHITKAGLVTRHFIDCGGTIRLDKTVNFQLWTADDTDHRLEPHKLLKIIAKYESLFGNEDLEIEAEYQGETIGRYGIGFNGQSFQLFPKQTDCLAKDNCGVPEKKKMKLSELTMAETACTPGGGCC